MLEQHQETISFSFLGNTQLNFLKDEQGQSSHTLQQLGLCVGIHPVPRTSSQKFLSTLHSPERKSENETFLNGTQLVVYEFGKPQLLPQR